MNLAISPASTCVFSGERARGNGLDEHFNELIRHSEASRGMAGIWDLTDLIALRPNNIIHVGRNLFPLPLIKLSKSINLTRVS